MRWTRYWLEVAILALAVGYPWLNGYRLTAEQARQAFRYVPAASRTVAAYDWDWGRTFVLETPSGWHTTLSCPRRFLLLWKCLYTNSEPAEAAGDPVRTVGWLSYRGQGEQVTLLQVRSADPRAAVLVAGPADDRRDAPLAPGESVALRWPRSLLPGELAAEVRAADGTTLYRYLDPGGRHQWRWVAAPAAP